LTADGSDDSRLRLAAEFAAEATSSSTNHPRSEETAMAATDKAKNSTQKAKGKVKEAAGKVTGNDKLRRKGKADQTRGSLKQAGENVKDALKR
jgi:uncharacterized protein YjbJ (UPF0337 family)